MAASIVEGPLGWGVEVDGTLVRLSHALPLSAEDANPQPQQAPRNLAPGVDVVAAGVDSLYVTIMGGLKPDVARALGELLALAKEGIRPRIVTPGGATMTARPFGAQPVWTVVLSGPWGTIRAACNHAPQAMEVQVSSWALWHHGIGWALGYIDALTREWCEPGARPQVQRVDLAADVTGWTAPPYTDGTWVTRARSWSLYGEGAITGMNIGTTPVQVSCYDKTREIDVSGKHWFRELWAAAGWDGTATVQRVEVRCHGRMLREMLGDDEDATPAALAIGEAFTSIWRYVLGKPARRHNRDVWDGWASPRVPSGDATRNRWPVDPVWRAIAGIRWGEGAAVFHRAPVHRAKDGAEGVAAGEWVAMLGGRLPAASLGAVAEGTLRNQVLGLLGALLGAESARVGGSVPVDVRAAAVDLVARLVAEAPDAPQRLSRGAGRWIGKHAWAVTSPVGRALERHKGAAPAMGPWPFDVVLDVAWGGQWPAWGEWEREAKAAKRRAGL